MNSRISFKKTGGSIKNSWLVHTSVWLLLFCMPFILMAGKTVEASKLIEHSWIPLIYYAIVFYLNYLWIIDKYLFTRQALWFIVVNLLVIIVLVSFNQLIKPLFFNQPEFSGPQGLRIPQNMPGNQVPQGPPPKMDGMKPPRKLFFYIDIFSMILPITVAIALKTSQRLKNIEKAHTESENAKLNSELQHLKYQIQPHFFFNSLNNIYSMVDSSPEKAKETIHSLSKLMRYLLYETNAEKVLLDNEINFMGRYIELMKLRTSAHTNVVYEFPEPGSALMVSPLLFISLVENAFKHGIAPQGISDIKILMRVIDKQILFETSNPYIPKTSTDLTGSAIGLDNIKKRLELLYQGKFIFKTAVENNRFIAFLSIETE